MKKSYIGALFLSSLVLLTACNTTEGVGKDMQSAGKEISKTADENK
ncbi:entericidin A/B family lipoprotein [Sandaracinobacteroides hominis]|nr:entericidin A/B family lipoprotein [Sandaracinobacteroides hominis]